MTQAAIIPMSKAERMLAVATQPEESRKIERLAKAAHAYAKEQNDYEAMVTATRIYILARRKTTELILPYIKPGRPNNDDNDVNILADFNLTAKQWNRRTKELSIAIEALETYFDECVANGWNPSVNGLMKSTGNGYTINKRLQIYNQAVGMLATMDDLTRDERTTLLSVTDIFKPEES